jgi:acyl-homoserine lactone acylase PvdQ
MLNRRDRHEAVRSQEGCMGTPSRNAVLGSIVVALVILGLTPSVGEAAVQPYGTNDAGGFRNVLPPGEDGVDNLSEALDFLGDGTYPEHWIDQQPLYEGLLYASPSLTDGQIPKYYKDATFGVRPNDVESRISPKPGVTILRDKGYGVPHVYGDTHRDVMFGAGYAAAADRLFLMDVLRHTGRGELSSFLGGSNLASDEAQWQFAPYTEQDLRSQITAFARQYGNKGQQLVHNLRSYVAGINAYIDDAESDPSLMPAEYGLLKQRLEPWKGTDVIATASLIGAIFGKGGGNELNSALTMKSFVARFGRKAGRRAWRDFREKNDPAAPTTARERFPYETTNAFAQRGLAIPKAKSVHAVPVGPTPPEAAVSQESELGAIAGIGDAIRRAMREGGHASNWELVSAAESKTGHPLAVQGPQLGYYDPQIFMEEDLHGPGIDARGGAFPGTNLYVQIGHGRDYAWSATTATSDNVDTFAEVLCQDGFHYMYKDRCLPMETLVRHVSWAPNAIDPTPAGSATLTAYRTVHGIVFARGRVDGKRVAFVHARTTYFHEADSVLGFADLNNPNATRDVNDFKRAVSKINFLFNWSYVDEKDIGYYMSGALPRRAPGTSPDFPILGTGQYDWQGYDPATHTQDDIGFDAHPQAVNPPYLVSWNNKQAPGFAAADDKYSYGALFRSQMIANKIERGIAGGRRMSLAQLVKAMEEPATQDLRGYRVLRPALRVIGKPGSRRLQEGIRRLRAWRKDGSHRRDLDQDGTYEHNRAVELLDAWWPLLLRAEFGPALGNKAFDRLQSMLRFGDHTRGSPSAPDFGDGWWSYSYKDLKDVLGLPISGRYSRVYCGNGSLHRCRMALRRSLRQALEVSPEELYGGGNGDCAQDPQPSCFDQNRSQIVSAISVPPFPYQNRPTYQQTTELTHSVPR